MTYLILGFIAGFSLGALHPTNAWVDIATSIAQSLPFALTFAAIGYGLGWIFERRWRKNFTPSAKQEFFSVIFSSIVLLCITSVGLFATYSTPNQPRNNPFFDGSQLSKITSSEMVKSIKTAARLKTYICRNKEDIYTCTKCTLEEGYTVESVISTDSKTLLQKSYQDGELVHIQEFNMDANYCTHYPNSEWRCTQEEGLSPIGAAKKIEERGFNGGIYYNSIIEYSNTGSTRHALFTCFK